MYQMHYYGLPARKLGTHPKEIPKVNPAGEQAHANLLDALLLPDKNAVWHRVCLR